MLSNHSGVPREKERLREGGRERERERERRERREREEREEKKRERRGGRTGRAREGRERRERGEREATHNIVFMKALVSRHSLKRVLKFNNV